MEEQAKKIMANAVHSRQAQARLTSELSRKEEEAQKRRLIRLEEAKAKAKARVLQRRCGARETKRKRQSSTWLQSVPREEKVSLMKLWLSKKALKTHQLRRHPRKLQGLTERKLTKRMVKLPRVRRANLLERKARKGDLSYIVKRIK